MKMRKPTDILNRQLAFLSDIRKRSGASLGALRPGGKLTAKRALAVYQKGYEMRLTDAIAANFEGLWYVLGDKKFFKLCDDYRKEHISTTYNLNTYGLRMPEYVKKKFPKQMHLFYLASFERLMFEVFNADEHDRLSVDISKLKPERDYFVFQPGVRLFESPFRVYDLWRNRKRLTKGYSPKPFVHPEFTLLYKHEHRHFFAPLSRSQRDIMHQLWKGKPIAAALEKSKASPAEVQALFSLLASPGIIQSIAAKNP